MNMNMNMQPKLALCFLALVVTAFTGCRTSTSAKADPWEHKLIASPIYQQVKKDNPHPGWVIESENKKEIIVAVGNRAPDKFDKWCDVKVVKATGELYRFNYNDAVKGVWLPLNSMSDPGRLF